MPESESKSASAAERPPLQPSAALAAEAVRPSARKSAAETGPPAAPDRAPSARKSAAETGPPAAPDRAPAVRKSAAETGPPAAPDRTPAAGDPKYPPGPMRQPHRPRPDARPRDLRETAIRSSRQRHRITDDPGTRLFHDLLRTAVLMLLAGALALVFAVPADTARHAAERGQVAVLRGGQGFAIAPDEADGMTPFGAERLIKVSGDAVSLLNIAGGVEFRLNIQLRDAQVLLAGDRALLYDRQGTQYCMLSTSGLIFQGQTESSIESAVCSDAGRVAFILSPPDTRGALLVLDRDGRQIMEWISRKSAESGYLIAAAFGRDDRAVHVSLMNTDGASIRPIIKRFSLENRTLGAEQLSLSPNLNGALPLICAVRDRHLWLSDGRTLYDYDEDTGVISVLYTFQAIRSMSVYRDGVAVTASLPDPGGLQLFYLSGSPGDADAAAGIRLGEEPGAPVVSGRYLAVGDGSRVLIVSQGDLSRPKWRTLSEPVLSLGLNSAGDLLSVTADAVLRLGH